MSSILVRAAISFSKPFYTRSITNIKSCLDRTEVSERIIGVVKGFDFVEAGKVTPVTHFTSDLGLDPIEVKTVVDAIRAEFCLEGCGCAKSPMSIDEITGCISMNPRAK